MNKSFKSKIFRGFINFLVLMCFVLSIVFTIFGFVNLSDAEDGIVVTYVVTFVSLFVSIVALLVSLKTYFSIDSVNSITSMEGNVLQNEHYSVSYPELINRLTEAKDIKGFTQIILEMMDINKDSTCTCVEFADWIQAIIDNIIWIAYVDVNDDTYKNSKKKLLDSLKKELKKYSELSNGIQHTLTEHIKLIENVFMYIEWSDSRSGNRLMSRLEEVRGGMIQNPISRTVYYDYLGLSYYAKACAIITERLAGNTNGSPSDSGNKDSDLKVKDRSIPERYTEINAYKFDENDLNHITVLLDKALESYDIAKEASMNDLLWDGYIRYNRIRVILLKVVTEGVTPDTDLEAIKLELVNIRTIRINISFLYSAPGSYIREEFDKEISLIEELNDRFNTFLATL